jgi:hypothetical protein
VNFVLGTVDSDVDDDDDDEVSYFMAPGSEKILRRSFTIISQKKMFTRMMMHDVYKIWIYFPFQAA